jgi:iron complex transport system substrate-binding protein
MNKKLGVLLTLIGCIILLSFTGCSSDNNKKETEANVKLEGLGNSSQEKDTAKMNEDKDKMSKETDKKMPEGMDKKMPNDMGKGKMTSMGSASLTVSEGEGYPVTITDIYGNEVTLEKKPEKIAAISGTFLGVLYDLGGKSICTSEIGGGAPVDQEDVKDLPVIGKVYNPDIEKIVALQPELVIAQFGLQNGVVKVLEQSNIKALALHMKTYEDVKDNIRAIGRIIDESTKAEEVIANMEKEKKALVDKLPEESKKVVILYATSKDVSVKLPKSIAGNVADILKLENIAKGCTPEGMGGETTPFSMEYIIEKDPDVILVTSMLSSDEDAKKVISEKLGKDPVWKELRAVKEGNIVYLPQKYFLYNAGCDFVDAIEYMAKGVYPQVFGGLDE